MFKQRSMIQLMLRLLGILCKIKIKSVMPCTTLDEIVSEMTDDNILSILPLSHVSIFITNGVKFKINNYNYNYNNYK